MCCIWTPLRTSLAGVCSELGREHWVREDCLGLEERRLYEPDPRWHGRGCAASASSRLSPAPAPGPSPYGAKKLARERDLPRAWILSDAAHFFHCAGQSQHGAALDAVQPMNEKLAATLLDALAVAASGDLQDLTQPGCAPDPRTEGAAGHSDQNRGCARGRT